MVLLLVYLLFKQLCPSKELKIYASGSMWDEKLRLVAQARDLADNTEQWIIFSTAKIENITTS